MKTAFIPRLEREGRSLEELHAALRNAGEVLNIDLVPWAKEYPHRPLVAAYMAYDAEALYISYVVAGQDLRTLSPGDGHYVHEDSCVEFFVQPERGEAYTNYEFNAAGVCYAAHHSSPSESSVLSADEFKSIERWGSHLGQYGLNEVGSFTWELCVALPWTTLGYEPGQLPNHFFANLYKCGDKTAHPHFLCWNHIVEDKPAFHRPRFFGQFFLLPSQGR